MKRWVWMGALVAVFAVATVAAAQENVMVLYGSPDRDWVAAIAAKFEKDTGIKTPWIRASSNEMYAKIEAEKANPQGDVWFGGTGDPHFAAAEAGLTEPYCPGNFSELREWMRDPIGNCRAIGLYAGPLGWAVNEGVLKKLGKPMPQTWDDLTKPEYKGLIAISNPTTAGTAYTALVTLLLLKGEDKGWDYLGKLHKNIAQYTKSGSAAGQLAGQGEVAIGIVFLHDSVMFAEEGFPVKPVAPADGTGYEIGGISLIKGAPHMANAKKFIDWALTPGTQAIAKDFRSFQLQSNKSTPLPAVVKKHGMDFESVKTIKYDFLWASKNRERIIKRWSEQIFTQAR